MNKTNQQTSKIYNIVCNDPELMNLYKQHLSLINADIEQRNQAKDCPIYIDPVEEKQLDEWYDGYRDRVCNHERSLDGSLYQKEYHESNEDELLDRYRELTENRRYNERGKFADKASQKLNQSQIDFEQNGNIQFLYYTAYGASLAWYIKAKSSLSLSFPVIN